MEKVILIDMWMVEKEHRMILEMIGIEAKAIVESQAKAGYEIIVEVVAATLAIVGALIDTVTGITL